MTESSIIAYAMRHPQSSRNVGGANLDDATPLTDYGKEQIDPIFNFIERKEIKMVFCSHADRTFGAVMERWHPGLELQVIASPFFSEWGRAKALQGLNPDSPEARRIKRRRLEELGPDFKPLPGENSWRDLLTHLYGGFRAIQTCGQSRVLVLTHLHKILMSKAYVYAGGVQQIGTMLHDDPLSFTPKFLTLFKAYEEFGYVDNTNFVEFEYRRKFDSDEFCWNVNEGCRLTL